jgi:hypothetical protein
MGKACVRFKKLDDLPLDVIGQAIARVPVERYIQLYEAARGVAPERPENTPARREGRRSRR